MARNVDRRSYLKYGGSSLITVAGAAAGIYYITSPRLGPSSKITPKEAQLTVSRMETEEEIGELFPGDKLMLPLPKFASGVMVEEAIAWRRSLRVYEDKPITVEQFSNLLWAVQGKNEFRYGFRTVPSAGATYPLEVYVVVASNGVVVSGTDYLPNGSYKYNYENHSVTFIRAGDLSEELAEASLNQEWVKNAPVNAVICAVYERTTKRYGERGHRYVHMEDGHAGQNIYLMASALGLGTVAIGAFHDEKVRDVIGADGKENPLYVMPIAVPKRPYRISEEEISEHYMKMRRGD